MSLHLFVLEVAGCLRRSVVLKVHLTCVLYLDKDTSKHPSNVTMSMLSVHYLRPKAVQETLILDDDELGKGDGPLVAD